MHVPFVQEKLAQAITGGIILQFLFLHEDGANTPQ